MLRADVAGLTFTRGDTQGLSAALVRLAEDPALRRRMGEAGRVTAAEWSWQARAGEFARVLESLQAEETS